MFAVDNLSGKIIWDRYYPSASGSRAIHSMSVSVKKRAQDYQSHHEHEEQQEGELAMAIPTITLLLYSASTSGPGVWSVEVINALTGELVQVQESHVLSGISVKHVVRFPSDLLYAQKDTKDASLLLSVLVLVDSQGKGHFFPSLPSSPPSLQVTRNLARFKKLVQENVKPIHFFVFTEPLSSPSVTTSIVDCTGHGQTMCGFKIDGFGGNQIKTSLVWKKVMNLKYAYSPGIPFYFL